MVALLPALRDAGNGSKSSQFPGETRFCNKASDGEGDGKSAVLGGEMAAFLEKPTASSEKLSVISDEESNAKR